MEKDEVHEELIEIILPMKGVKKGYNDLGILYGSPILTFCPASPGETAKNQENDSQPNSFRRIPYKKEAAWQRL